MRKPPKGDHSFQPAGAGKGDADRTSDVQSFRANYDEIDWGRKATGVFTPDFAKLLRDNGLVVDDRPLHYNARDGTITTLDLRKRWLGRPLTGHKRSWIERND